MLIGDKTVTGRPFPTAGSEQTGAWPFLPTFETCPIFFFFFFYKSQVRED